jgi:CDP-4-dehydro-6-deoxyglucose reductase
MQQWYPATITESVQLGDSLSRLTMRVPREVAGSFLTPGQYHRVRIAESDNHFAIASGPGQPDFSYLVRPHKALGGRWASLPVGAEVQVGPVEGPGFPLRLARDRALVMVATGTGFAPIRSVLEAIAAERQAYGPVHALVGVHAASELAWGADAPRWASLGLHVHTVVSRPDPSWKGATGHVQAHLGRLPIADAVAFLCGQAEMVETVSDALAQRGLPPERVFLNLARW